MSVSPQTFYSIELQALCTPPKDWIAQVTSLATRDAKTVELDGKSVDCREHPGEEGMTYGVVTGETIAKELPWLMKIYRIDLANFVSTVLARPVIAADIDRYGVNINVVQGLRGHYEWHVDPSPVAAILFATAHDIGDGGELALRAGPGERVIRIYPRPGLVVVFEGRRVEHAVLPLIQNSIRISVPMLYYDIKELQYFPQELDDYLYGTAC